MRDRLPAATRWGAALGLALLTIYLYWPVRTHEFVNYDDDRYVTNNPYVKAGLSVAGLRWALTAMHAGNWHPMTWASHMLDVSVLGLAPGPQHLVNVALHAANAALLLVVLSAATGRLWASAFVAALFAVHPLHVESVAWISERKDVLSTFFWVLAIGAYLRQVQRPGGRRFHGVALLFALGLLAKPMLVTMPLVLLLLDYWPLQRILLPSPGAGATAGRPGMLSLGEAVREKIPFFLLAAASATITFLAQKKGGAVSTLELYPFWTRVANAIDASVIYLGMMLWPTGLAAFYPHPGATIPIWQPILAMLLLAAITVTALLMLRRMPYLLFGWLWYAVTLIPVIGLVQVGGQALADRYTYVPLVGLFVAATWAASDMMTRRPHGRIALAGLAGLALACLIPATRTQLGFWRDSKTLFTRALEVTSGNYLAYNNLGQIFYKEGRLGDAKKNFTEALRFAPWYSVARNNLALVFSDEGRDEEARSSYATALTERPNYAEAQLNLGILLAKKGDETQAAAHYREAIRLKPELAEAYVNLGAIEARQGNSEDAIAHFRKARDLKPELSEARFNLGEILLQLGRTDEAAREYAAVVDTAPGNDEAQYLLGDALLAKGDTKAAIGRYLSSLRLRPDRGEVRNSLGLALAREGRWIEAEAQYREALRLNPRNLEALANLGSLFLRQGRYDEAVSSYHRALEMDASRPELHYNLGIAFERKGDDEEATVHYQQALIVRPGYAEARARLEKLQSQGGRR